MVDLINQACGFVVGLLLAPFAKLDPFWGLLVASALSGVVLLMIYGKVSNQQKIKALKQKIYANILETVLYRHDLGLSLRAQGRLLKCSALYLLLAIPPLIVLLVPCLLLLAQLNLYYSNRGLEAGESAILKVSLADEKIIRDITLDASPGLEITPPVRSLTDKEIAWRVTAKSTEPQWFALKVGNGSAELREEVHIRGQDGRINAILSKDWLTRLFYPVDKLGASLAALPFRELSLSYPARDFNFLGFELNWLVVFFVVSLLSGVVASRYLKIEI